jgi:hypothetical protein
MFKNGCPPYFGHNIADYSLIKLHRSELNALPSVLVLKNHVLICFPITMKPFLSKKNLNLSYENRTSIC